MHIYENYNLYELRTLGREKGVKAPTTFKRRELIEQIINIDNGIFSPYDKNTKQGRPVKSANSFEFTDIESNIQKIKIKNFLLDFQMLCRQIDIEIENFLKKNKDFLK